MKTIFNWIADDWKRVKITAEQQTTKILQKKMLQILLRRSCSFLNIAQFDY